MGLRKLSDIEIERLINLWHDEPVLWDVHLPHYANIDSRKAALVRIGQQMNTDTGVVEAKMRSLRVELSSTLRALKKKSGTEGKQKRPWRFMDSLMFLKETVMPRGNISNLPDENTEDEGVTNAAATEQASDTMNAATPACATGASLQHAASSSSSAINLLSTDMNTADKNVPVAKKAKKVGLPEGLETTALASANAVMTAVAQQLANKEAKPPNATRHFCDMLYQQLTAFPEEDRELLQYEIHGLMMRRRQHRFAMNNAATPACATSASPYDAACSSSSALSLLSTDTVDNTDWMSLPTYYHL